MTITIDLSPEVEAALEEEAREQGVALPEYLGRRLSEGVLGTRPGAVSGLPGSEKARLWRESVKGLPDTPPLSDEAIGRESIYGGGA